MARSYQLSAFGTQVPYRELYKIIVSATYTLVPDDNNKILIFSLGANATVNLPAAAAVEGMTFKIWNGNSGAFTVTIDPQGAEQIDGAATLVLDPGEGARCYAFAGGLPTSTGARWITDRVNATDVFSTAVIAGSTKNSVVRYTGTTATAGAFNGSATTPTGTGRLNFEGYFYPSFINLVGSADTATAASHYFVETASDGFVRPKTLASTQAEIVTAATVYSVGVTSGTATQSFVAYNSTTATAGRFDGGTTDPTGTTRLNYGGNFYSTSLNLVGTADTATAASHYFVETASDGFVRPKTLANARAEIVTAASVYSVGVVAGIATQSFVQYNSTTATAGAFDGGAVAPTGTTRLNYSGNFHANNFFGTTINNIIFNSATATTTSTTQTALLTVPSASHTVGKVFIRATRGTERQATELLITHDGTTAISTEYGTIATANNLFTTEVDINSTNLRVLVTATSATSTAFVIVYTFI